MSIQGINAKRNGKIFKKQLKDKVVNSGYVDVKKSELKDVLHDNNVRKILYTGFIYKNSRGLSSNNGFVLINKDNGTATFIHGQSQKVAGSAIDKVEGQIHNLSNMVMFNNLSFLNDMEKKALYVIDGSKAIEDIHYVEHSAIERGILDKIFIEVCKLSDLNNKI